MRWNPQFKIGERLLAQDQPTYFIADIASNHDGDLERAKELIHIAAEAGTDCAKFQHFLAEDIVSDAGFRQLGGQMAHQAAWSRSVYEVFKACEVSRDWTQALVDECAKADVDYMTTPYDFAAIEHSAPHLQAFKVGSGDIGWPQFIDAVARQNKPVFLSTGASDMADVVRAVDAALAVNADVCLMQCNTNYTGDLENFAHVNLNVLRTFALKWPGMLLGLSDHTAGHAAVLGAVTLGARAVEKHFTDDTTRTGPDHPFSMDPRTWREMVDRTRELELALGDGVKRVEANERDAAVVQRRALRLGRDLPAGHIVREEDLEALRPRPAGAFEPADAPQLIGARLVQAKQAGDALSPTDIEAIGSTSAAA